MHSFKFDSMILGTTSIGQGSVVAVDGTHRTTLRKLVAYVRGLSLRLGDWRAPVLKHAAATMAPALAVCPSQSANRCQRENQRWMSAVAVDRGPAGVR